GRAEAIRQQRAQTENHAVAPPANDFGSSEFDRRAVAAYRGGVGFGIANRNRSVLTERKLEHRRDVAAIAWSHHDEIRQTTDIGDIKTAVVGWAVRTSQP